MLRVIPKETHTPEKGLYEAISYEVLREDEPVGQILVDRVRIDRSSSVILSTLTHVPELEQAVEIIDEYGWDPCVRVDLVRALIVHPRHRGNEYGGQALLSIPSPSGTWQVITLSENTEGHDDEEWKRYLMRFGFRDVASRSGKPKMMIRNNMDTSAMLS